VVLLNDLLQITLLRFESNERIFKRVGYVGMSKAGKMILSTNSRKTESGVVLDE
jgi:hypothetical protein